MLRGTIAAGNIKLTCLSNSVLLPVLALGPLRDVARALVADAAAEHELAVAAALGAFLEGAEHHRVREAVQYLEKKCMNFLALNNFNKPQVSPLPCQRRWVSLVGCQSVNQ